MEGPQNIKNIITYDLIILLLGNNPKKIRTQIPKVSAPMFIAICYNIQGMEATSVSINRWMDKGHVTYILSEVSVIRMWSCHVQQHGWT